MAEGLSLVTQQPPTLDGLLSLFQHWLDIPDTGGIEVVLGAYAANRLAGDPVWLLVIGAKWR